MLVGSLRVRMKKTSDKRFCAMKFAWGNSKLGRTFRKSLKPSRLPMITARRSRSLAVACAIALAGGASNSFASGFQLQEQSASQLGKAFSGTAASAEDATVLFYNPAGMSQLKESEVTLVATG